MIETIIVIVVVMILSAVAIVRWDLAPMTRSSAARKVAADIRYAQKLAISTQARSAIAFSANGYTVYRDITTLNIAVSPGDPCSTGAAGNFVVDFSEARCSDFSGVTIFPAVTIAFNSMGSPVDAVGVSLPTQNVLIIVDVAQVVSVEADTGRVSY